MLYIELLRIKHWGKNVLVLTGILVACYLVTPQINLWICFLGFLIACCASSANYVLNEVLDAPFDRHHPEKKTRPLASEEISRIKAMLFYSCLVGISLFSAYQLINFSYGYCILALLISGIIYNVKPLRAKDICWLDVIIESLNSPIRLLLGWYLVAPMNTFPRV